MASGAALALTLAALAAGSPEPAALTAAAARGYGEPSQLTQGTVCTPRAVALQERDAIAGSLSSSFLPQQVLVGRGRARLQPHAQSALRLVRERQAAIVTAFSHRMRDASGPGAASHIADRPRVVTRPLRGPPARA